MKEISNADFKAVLRLLGVLAGKRGCTVREKEDARKAALLSRKLRKRYDGPGIHKAVPLD